ncbi:MAG TPA: phage tail sheath C-terminal domain-containing protein [Pyrinomonadaceae bacterium]|nr:phage tail sheath C-terminal domain-containing protein [Pyrinomonadaceae bacterium]
MPEYLAPGVYIEEIQTGPRPIEGVSTSTAGFIGQTERGPTNPTLVTSWQSYYRWFGGYIDRPPNTFQNVFLPYAARGFFDNGGQRLFIARVVGPAAAPATADIGNCVIEAIGEGEWGNNMLVSVKPASVAVAASPTADWFRIQVAYYRDGIPSPFVDPTDLTQLGNPDRVEPDVFEDYDNLSAVSTDPNFALAVINAGSNLIKVISCTGRPGDADFPGTQMENGVTDAATLTEYLDANTINPEDRKGLAGLLTIRDISLVSAPDEVVVAGLREEIIQACEANKDRFAVVSSDGNISNFTNLRPPRDTTYAAFYYPWVRVLAPHTPEGHRLIPSNGHVTGIYARVDIERGVHKAPANEVIRGILTRDLTGNKKPLEFTLGKRDHDILNPKGVNVIRDFRTDGRDIRVFGARTMSSDTMWKYINVRRLFIFIEQSIDRGTQWAVFEPNSEITWTAIRTAITAFLRTVWLNGALMGTTQDEAFFVKCDRTTMTQDDIDNGRLICLIGIAPVKPAEFVIFRISQKTLEAEQ